MRSLVFVFFSLGLLAADYPQAEISNGIVHAKLHLPDPKNGSYQATRFDWSGIIYSLKYKDHEYFGRWYAKHDPKINDAITGPVEEFRTNDAGLGYSEAPKGGTFIRIGVGIVRKPDEAAYKTFETYDIVDPGAWKVRKGADWIEFTHVLTSKDGYAYVYRKKLKLLKGKPELVLEHSLKNTGKKVIDTTQYNHNFFVIDGETVGPDVAISFAFQPKPDRDLKLAEFHGKDLEYPRELVKGESVFAEMSGFGGSPSDYDFRIVNKKSGAGVRITSDQPLAKVVFWSIRTVACPEPYIHLNIEPGHEKKWRINYEFYTTK
jgi:hypothetical protein